MLWGWNWGLMKLNNSPIKMQLLRAKHWLNRAVPDPKANALSTWDIHFFWVTDTIYGKTKQKNHLSFGFAGWSFQCSLSLLKWQPVLATGPGPVTGLYGIWEQVAAPNSMTSSVKDDVCTVWCILSYPILSHKIFYLIVYLVHLSYCGSG